MKTEFDKEYITNNRCCYEKNKVEKLSFINNVSITLLDMATAEDLPEKDFCWFFINKCNLDEIQKVKFAVYLAEKVLHIFEEDFKDDDRPRKAIEATKKYLKGDISNSELYASAAAAAAATSAAADAAFAAICDADVAAATAEAAEAAEAAACAAATGGYASAAAYAAEAAAYAADAANYNLRKDIIDYIKKI